MPDKGMRIGISIFLFLFWVPMSFLIFFVPYHIIMKNKGKPIYFYLLSLLAFVFFFIWSIADFADANGFVMAASNIKAQRLAAGAFGFIISVMMLAVALLTFWNAIVFFQR
jgi:hypothetical protein